MELVQGLLTLQVLKEKGTLSEKKYELPNYDIITNISNITTSATSPIGDIIEVKTFFGDYQKRYKQGELYIISTNFLSSVNLVDTTSIKLEILDYQLNTFNPSDYTNYFLDKFVYMFSGFISKESESLSQNLLNVQSEIYYDSYSSSIDYYNTKSLYNSLLSKFNIAIAKSVSTNRYEYYIQLDGTNIPDEFYTKISNLYCNIQVFGYDTAFFFDNVNFTIYNDNLYTYGYLKTYKTNLLNIRPHFSFQFPNEKSKLSVRITDNQLNKNTEFEEQLGISEAKKLVFFINISLKPLQTYKDIFENVQTLPFFVII